MSLTYSDLAERVGIVQVEHDVALPDSRINFLRAGPAGFWLVIQVTILSKTVTIRVRKLRSTSQCTLSATGYPSTESFA